MTPQDRASHLQTHLTLVMAATTGTFGWKKEGAALRATTLEPLDNPSWLLDPPSGAPVPPPVSSREQLLPLAALEWQDFERLCLRLAKLDGEAEHWQLYGTAGQKQGGIDIFVRSPGASKYRVWQAKRYQKVRASDIKRAVDKFLAGPWADKSERFIFCTTALLEETDLADAIEDASVRLREQDIIFDARGAAKLSETLKSLPEAVDDFFDRPWTERFCGREAANALGERLARADYRALRVRLGRLYAAHFAAVDPGVLRATGSMGRPEKALSLGRRFVPTDFVSTDPERASAIEDQPAAEPYSIEEWQDDGLEVRRASRSKASVAAVARLGLEQWVPDVDRAILFAPPGAGKSTLLRFLTLELLSEAPRFATLKRRWPDHLPLIISFPFWTRLIQNGIPGASMSIPAVVSAWLEAHGEPDLARLAARAFHRRRVLLLIDGVDEWADEPSAATALTLLQAFAETRNIPAVVTSRPHGARLLGTLDATWQRYALAPFSIPQQMDFAEAWYSFLADQDGLGSGSSRARAESFIAELQALPDVAVLAGVPLLLGGLMALAREGSSLPRNRFQAYRELAERLITLHSRARSRAALAGQAPTTLDAQTRELVFAALAFAIQARRTGEERLDAIGKKEALDHCKRALQDHLDLPPDAARRQAQELLDVGAEAIGILVEKSPHELGFMHRAFQELLAAKHIDGLSLEQQCAIMREQAHNPQWRDILLFVAQFASRPGDVDHLVDAIERAPAGATDEWSRPLLLADIAFGEVRRSHQLTKRLAAALFTTVETGADLDQRADILRRVVAGLASDQTAILVRPKLKSWFPRFHAYQVDQALPIIAKWNEAEVDAILWRNLESDEEPCRGVAAEELAKRHAGSDAWRQRAMALLRRPSSIATAAAAITLLDLGWGDEDATRALVDEAARNPVADIKIAGLQARIRARRQTPDDRDVLRGWLDEDDWELHDAAAQLLGSGWPYDPNLKADVLARLQASHGRSDHALRIAAHAFGGDREVSEAIAEAICRKGSILSADGLWTPLAKNFAGDTALANRLATVGIPARIGPSTTSMPRTSRRRRS